MISCCVNFKEKANIPYCKLLIKQMNDAQSRERGPGCHISEHAALCASGGVLSRICEGYQFIIAFEGELYGKTELVSELKALGYRFTENSDAELALFAYIHYGEKSPGKLKGSFSYVIYDTMRGQLFAACDLFASRPLFYAKTGDAYLLASQIRGIFAHPDVIPRVKPDGISRVLMPLGYCAGSVFDGIEMLAPVHILKIRDEKVTVKRYALSEKNAETELGNAKANRLKNGITERFLQENGAEIRYEAENVSECVSKAEISEAIGGLGNVGVFFSGRTVERNICRIAAEKQAEKFRRIAVYSALECGVPGKYTAERRGLFPDVNGLYSALSECVLSGGIPLFSESDFLLAYALKRAAKDGVTLLIPQPEFCEKSALECGLRAMRKLLNRRVFETIEAEEGGDFFGGTAVNIAASAGAEIKVIMPEKVANNADLSVTFAAVEVSGKVPGVHGEGIKTSENGSKSVYNNLKRILLDLIASGSEPFLAFYDKNAILNFCERGAGMNLKEESALMAYLIKFNIWLSEFKPYII